jgi:protein ImuB
MRRPLTLLADPLPLAAVEDRADPVIDRVPEAFRCGGKTHRIVRYWGPERLEAGWWQGASVRRDYYRVETDRGDWWWIFRRLESPPHAWMLHGRFA